PDGSVRFGSGCVSISQKEPELLDKVGKLIGHSGKMTFRPRREYQGRVAGELYTLKFSSDRVVADLVRLGLRPRKSLTLQFPDMPVDMRRHFIRGCWDGDGSVYIDKQSKRIKASFVSGSLNFVKGMVSELTNANLPVKTIYTNKRKIPSYYFRLTGKQVLNFYHYLYDDVPPTQYLERKFNLFRLSLEMNPS
ncbi:LAGLIDADG family homing endonuclease, partial [Patescibacteria group bacterium]|nr:LAGLIDADG family homing endonuclease [Patescibacteria group bacterium]